MPSVLNFELAILKPMAFKGFGIRIEVGTGECVVEIGAFW